MKAPLRVVVVEDSPTQRAHLTRVLQEDRDIEVVAAVATREEALAAVLDKRPGVVTMDLVIPGGGRHDALAGLAAIRDIMALVPTPILVVSSRISDRESHLAIEALAAGAADAFPRPPSWNEEQCLGLRDRVRVLSGVVVVRRHPPRTALKAKPRRGGGAYVALGASTGGPPALRTVLETLAGLRAPVLVVQHLHDDFVAGFTGWLGDSTGMPASVVAGRLRPEEGHVYVAPSGRHLRLDRNGFLVLDAEPASLHRPSVDELFGSLAENADGATVAALLTGMGEDGARGLKAIRDSGGVTIAQDEATSAVYGMPRAGRESGGAAVVLPLNEIGPAIRRALAGTVV